MDALCSSRDHVVRARVWVWIGYELKLENAQIHITICGIKLENAFFCTYKISRSCFLLISAVLYLATPTQSWDRPSSSSSQSKNEINDLFYTRLYGLDLRCSLESSIRSAGRRNAGSFPELQPVIKPQCSHVVTPAGTDPVFRSMR